MSIVKNEPVYPFEEGNYYKPHHIIVKANLFFIAGAIAWKTGSEDLDKIGGLYKAAPLLSLLFLIPALSLAGIPPLSGFWAKFIVVQASLEAEAWWVAFAALAVGLITLFSMTKITGNIHSSAML